MRRLDSPSSTARMRGVEDGCSSTLTPRAPRSRPTCRSPMLGPPARSGARGADGSELPVSPAVHCLQRRLAGPFASCARLKASLPTACLQLEHTASDGCDGTCADCAASACASGRRESAAPASTPTAVPSIGTTDPSTTSTASPTTTSEDSVPLTSGGVTDAAVRPPRPRPPRPPRPGISDVLRRSATQPWLLGGPRRPLENRPQKVIHRG